MKKKILVFILSIIFLISSFPLKIIMANNISAKSYCVMEASSERILYGKNIHEKLPMASTTKIMTAILAIENGNLNDVINIKKEWTGIEGTSIYLKENEKLTLEDLLYGLMLVSGNDAAVSIASYISGSVDKFAALMNKKAKNLGMINTNFVNPHGLPNENHYTSAYDFALLTSYAMKNETFIKIINANKWSMPYENKENGRVIYNKNKLLKSYEGANGVKTGFTKAARKCFVFAANRNNMQVVGVLLKSEDHYPESKSLLNMSFNEYKLNEIIGSGDYVKTLEDKNNKDITYKLYIKENIYFPFKKNEDIKVKFNKIENIGNNNFILNYSVITKEKEYKYKTPLNKIIEKRNSYSLFYKLVKKYCNLI